MFSKFNCRLLVPALILALFVSSCSKNKIGEEEVAIGFFATLPNTPTPETRAADISPLKSSDKIGVFGYLVHDGTNGSDGEVLFSTPYISHNQIAYSADDDLWHFDRTIWWPSIGYKAMKFFAYWPYVSKPNTENTSGLSLFTSTTSAPYFKYVTNLSDKAAQEDFLISQNSGWRNEFVPLLFKRPLSKVIWKVKNKDWIGNNGFELILQVYDKATFHFSEETASQNADVEDDGDGWSDYSTTKKELAFSYDGLIQGGATSSTTGVDLATCYLIPQQITELTIIYNYHKEKYTLPAPIDLLAGRQHTITISIGKDYVIEVETSEGEDKWYNVNNENDLTTN